MFKKRRLKPRPTPGKTPTAESQELHSREERFWGNLGGGLKKSNLDYTPHKKRSITRIDLVNLTLLSCVAWCVRWVDVGSSYLRYPKRSFCIDFLFFSALMLRPWGSRLKRNRSKVLHQLPRSTNLQPSRCISKSGGRGARC